jgi:peptide/nickel transport system permease protein
METTKTREIDAGVVISDRKVNYWYFLLRDPLPLISFLWLVLMGICSFIGPEWAGDAAVKMDLRARNFPPFSIEHGWMQFLGTDSLGRSMLVRIIVATRNTMGIALFSTTAALIIGGIVGIFAGYVGKWPEKIIMQISDIIQSFPSMLLAMVVLYILEPKAFNLVIVLAFTRLPVYIRVARSEVLELRERLFVDAARVLGSSNLQIMTRHIAPMASPTVITYWTVDVAFVMLSESGLSFLGIGIQPPEITWGLMVAHGRNYLEIAWWQCFFPGLMIMMSTLSINLLASWVRRITDPMQRWRFEVQK